jgi:hypothetical protein
MYISVTECGLTQAQEFIKVLIRADVSVDVAKEEGLKNGCVDVVHGAVCQSLWS